MGVGPALGAETSKLQTSRRVRSCYVGRIYTYQGVGQDVGVLVVTLLGEPHTLAQC